MEKVNRVAWLDLLRCIAIAMIVFMHSPNPDIDLPGYIMTGISYLTAPGIGLFFMLSGSLLLEKEVSTKSFLAKRFSKIVIPTLFWTVIYLFVGMMSHTHSISEIIKILLSVPFSRQGHGILWFMYTLVGLYLLTPVLSRWTRVATKREVEFYLFLWAITLLYPYLKTILFINESNTGILYYFSGYAGYYLFGFYLKRHYSFRFYHLLIALAISVLIPVLVYSIDGNPDFYSLLWYLSLPVVSMAFIWFVGIKQLSFNGLPGIELASKMSFGIYFVHALIIQKILWNSYFFTSMNDWIEIIATAAVGFGLSFCFSWLVSKMPFSKCIIGV